ncbi:MAG: BlaI/MecI/CopY family transcriptional regulator [Terriglobales bacterium]
MGPLEAEVMTQLWTHRGETSVRDLLPRMGRPLAYTTLMTTLDRLFKKGLLLRRKADRAFLYTPRCTRPEWESERAGAMVQALLEAPGVAHGLVLSTLVEAVGPGHEELLAALEAKIRAQRQALRAAPPAAERPR